MVNPLRQRRKSQAIEESDEKSIMGIGRNIQLASAVKALSKYHSVPEPRFAVVAGFKGTPGGLSEKERKLYEFAQKIRGKNFTDAQFRLTKGPDFEFDWKGEPTILQRMTQGIVMTKQLGQKGQFRDYRISCFFEHHLAEAADLSGYSNQAIQVVPFTSGMLQSWN